MLARAPFVSILVSLALGACGDPPVTPPDAGTDAASDPSDAGTDAGPPGPDVCDELGLPRTPFRVSGAGDDFGEVAGDFTAQLRDGTTFRFSERWSGCESYVFFTHFPGLTDDVIRSNPDLLFQEGRRNVRYFFLSDEEDAAARAALMDELAASLETGFEFGIPDEAERAFWRSRFHFVTDRATEIDGSVGAMLSSYLAWARTPESRVDIGDGRGLAGAPAPIVFGIDRAQAWDGGDSLSPSVGANPMLGMAAYLGHFYEYRFALESRLATEEATVVTLLDERTTGRVFTQTVTLPDAAAMAAFDTLEVDVEITCDERNPFACSEWDRNAYVQLCVDGEACTEKREIARWITPYWRRGRQHWVIDATPFLGLMRPGGAQTFFVELGPDADWKRATEWVARVALRLRTRGGEPLAVGGQRAFVGGVYEPGYDEAHPPVTFTPPAGATRVELVTIVSGHGQTPGPNCAEWCDHQHSFSVNGTPLPTIAHDGPIGAGRGCAARASEGVIPGQWGNWAQSRAYWCPGLPVPAERTDITSLVTLGMTNTLSYRSTFGDAAEPPAWSGTSEPRIDLSAYVIWYED